MEKCFSWLNILTAVSACFLIVLPAIGAESQGAFAVFAACGFAHMFQFIVEHA